jgi:RHS repeat-associated protein
MRYRGYYWDAEIGFYYLQSRYYNPEWGRFISADEAMVLQLTGDQLLGVNLFAYCGNNPVMFVDSTGYGPVGAVIGSILGFGLGVILTPYIADLMGLKGWKRTAFIWGGTAVITALGAWAGYYIGEAIFRIYKVGGTFASKINEVLAKGVAKVLKATITHAKGEGWVIKLGRVTLRLMTQGSQTNYFRISVLNKGALTIAGLFSNNQSLTHIPITITTIVQIVALVLKFK